MVIQRNRWSVLFTPARMQVFLATVMFLPVLLLHLGRRLLWPTLVLDLITYLTAAACSRWPRAGAVVLGAILAGYVFLPTSWPTVGEYAALIPILGAGMRGDLVWRRWISAAYLILLVANSWTDMAEPNLLLAALPWVVLIGVIWIIGSAFHASEEAHRLQQAAELIELRDSLTRALHDTVARSLTKVALNANRAQLRGEVTPADLEAITLAATKAVDELRWMMALLRDAPDPGLALAVPATPIGNALVAGEQELKAEGFAVVVRPSAELQRLAPAQAAALGSVLQEAVANVIKHGDRQLPAAIIAEPNEQSLDLLVVNAPRVAESGDSGGHLGLWSMRQRLSAVGGDLMIEEDPSIWLVRARVPLSDEVRHG